MKKIISLFKTDFNISFGLSSIKYGFKNKKNRWQYIVLAIALMSLIPSYFMIIKGLNGIYDIYEGIGQKSMFLLSGFLLAQVLVFLFGLLYVMSKYYFSNDLGHLVPLPIKPSHILGAKFGTLMFSEYLTSLPIILPFIIIYGLKAGEGLVYWLYSFLLVLFLPVIPLVLASICIMIFMKYTNIGKNKERLRLVSAIIFMIVLVYGQLKIQSFSSRAIGGGQEFLQKLVMDSNILVKKLGLSFPPSQWASLALANTQGLPGLAYLLVFIGLSILTFFIMIYLAEKIFFDGLIGNIEVVAKKGRARGNKGNLRLGKQRSPALALAKKELIMLFKTPIYLLNSVSIVIFLPVIMLFSSMMGGDQSRGEIMVFLRDFKDLISLVGIGYISGMGMLNSIGSTSFSREGKSLWIQRSLPIRVKDQILGRLLSSLAVQVLGLVSFFISISFLVRLDIINILFIVIFGFLGSTTMTLMGMTIDIIRPLLDWDNPQKAIKQNLNVLIGMGLGSLYLGAFGYLIFKILDVLSINIIYLIIVLGFTLTSIVLYSILKKLIEKQFEILE